jgi:hypothetical protein
MKYDIDEAEWYPILVPSFTKEYDTMYSTPIPALYDFTDEEIYIIKNAFMLFDSAQDILKEKMELGYDPLP